MANSQETSDKRRWGFFRWIVIMLIVGNVLAVRAYSSVMPHVQVPPENVAGPVLGQLYLTNTMVALLLADLLIVIMAIVVRRATSGGALILDGFAGVIEVILEALFGLVESTAGKRARQIFPWVATIVLMVLVVNWMELFPGVDSIGEIHEPHHGAPAYETQRLGALPIITITEEVEAEEWESEHREDLVGFTPFVRVASTDLNFTLALALVSVGMTQVIGVRAVGTGYFEKFFQFDGLIKMPLKDNLGPFDLIFPITDVFVGILELIAEIAKIVSFSFRLFGNIFAGSVLLFVMGSLVPVLVQSGFLLLELFVGLIQALVFGMLTMVFMTMATVAHDEEGEAHGAAH